MRGESGRADGSRPAPGLREAVLEAVRVWNPTTRSLFLRLPPGQDLEFKPGQFISLEFSDPGADPCVRAYSLCSAPEEGGVLELCVDLVPGGRASARLFALEPGAQITFKGPFGSFVLDEPPEGEMVFVAEGTGIAPIRPMVRRAVERGAGDRVRVLHGARYEADLVYREDFEAWRRAAPGLCWEPVLAGASGSIGSRLETIVRERYGRPDAARGRRIWICGVGDAVPRLRDLLRASGYDRRAVRYEQW